MAIIKEEIIGTRILNEIESSNVVKSEYDTETKKMIVEFKNGQRYEYDDVSHQTYTQFRLSESQGKFFNENIGKKYTFKKVS